MLESSDGGKGCEILSSEHDMPLAVINLQQLWLPTLGLHKAGPLNS